MRNRAYVHIKFDHFFRLKFHNFVPKYTSSMKLLQLVQQTLWNLMQLTEVQ